MLFSRDCVGSCTLEIRQKCLFSWGAVTSTGQLSTVLIHYLGVFGGKQSEARAINDSGQVVVVADFLPGQASSMAYRWSESGIEALTYPGGYWTTAWDINNSGWVVGGHNIPYYSQACIWKGSQCIDIGSSNSWAFDVNDAGVVAGLQGANVTLWNGAGEPDKLPVPEGETSLYAIDINNLNQVIANGSNRAYIWQGLGWSALPVIDGYSRSSVHGFNDFGQMVGYNRSDNDSTLVALWDNGSVCNLTNRIVGSPHIQMTYASGVNNKGQIVGKCFDIYKNGEYAIVLTPIVPEPSSIVGLIAGFGGFFCLRIRKHRA